MSSNGYADAGSANPQESSLVPDSAVMTPVTSPDEIKRLVRELELPFAAASIEWRVTNTSQDKTRGQIVPYADQRAYTDRLNTLFTPAGWTRRFSIHTSANFERSKDQKIVAKVLVTCELTIFGLGSHSATGEEWADNDNAGTSAEAQAFKRACSCFGLGRYLYYFEGVWVDLDERRRPKSIPQLPSWATPTGWAQGLRPNGSARSNASGKWGQYPQCWFANCISGERNREHGRTAWTRAVPRTVAGYGKSLEPARNPGCLTPAASIRTHAVRGTRPETFRGRPRQSGTGGSCPHSQGKPADLDRAGRQSRDAETNRGGVGARRRKPFLTS